MYVQSVHGNQSALVVQYWLCKQMQTLLRSDNEKGTILLVDAHSEMTFDLGNNF